MNGIFVQRFIDIVIVVQVLEQDEILSFESSFFNHAKYSRVSF